MWILSCQDFQVSAGSKTQRLMAVSINFIERRNMLKENIRTVGNILEGQSTRSLKHCCSFSDETTFLKTILGSYWWQYLFSLQLPIRVQNSFQKVAASHKFLSATTFLSHSVKHRDFGVYPALAFISDSSLLTDNPPFH